MRISVKKNCLFVFSGTFRWNDDKDRLLLVEIRTVEPFKFKKNSKESGHAWAKVAEGVNQHGIFTSMPRDERSVRDRFKKLLTDFMAKIRREEGESGTSPEPLSENETLLEEIEEKMRSAKSDLEAASAKDDQQQKSERKKAMAARDAAMKTWSKSAAANGDSDGEEGVTNSGGRGRKRRRGSDVVQFLETKRQDEAELRKEEMALRRQEMALQNKRQEQFEQQMLQQQQQAQQQTVQMQQQFAMQQQQAQQVQQLMMLMMQKIAKD